MDLLKTNYLLYFLRLRLNI